MLVVSFFNTLMISSALFFFNTIPIFLDSIKPPTFVIIGQRGLTDAVLDEIDVALNAHELIKIRIRGADKKVRSEQHLKIEKKLDAEIIHQIGFVTVLFRLKPDNQ